MSYMHCCLPRRLRSLVERTAAQQCAQCNEPDGKRRFKFAETMAYRCTNDMTTNVIHFLLVSFCDRECGDECHAMLAIEGYEYLVAWDAKTVATDALAQRLLAFPRQATGGRCNGCTAQHYGVMARFKACARCHAVNYCSPECQAEHWKSTHKKECKRMAAAAVAQEVKED